MLNINDLLVYCIGKSTMHSHSDSYYSCLIAFSICTEKHRMLLLVKHACNVIGMVGLSIKVVELNHFLQQHNVPVTNILL